MSIKEKLAFIENIEKSQSMPSFVVILLAKINNPKSTVADEKRVRQEGQQFYEPKD